MKMTIDIDVSYERRLGDLYVHPQVKSNMRLSHEETKLDSFMLDMSVNSTKILYDIVADLQKIINNFDLSAYPLIPIPPEIQEMEREYQCIRKDL